MRVYVPETVDPQYRKRIVEILSNVRGELPRVTEEVSIGRGASLSAQLFEYFGSATPATIAEIVAFALAYQKIRKSIPESLLSIVRDVTEACESIRKIVPRGEPSVILDREAMLGIALGEFSKVEFSSSDQISLIEYVYSQVGSGFQTLVTDWGSIHLGEIEKLDSALDVQFIVLGSIDYNITVWRNGNVSISKP